MNFQVEAVPLSQIIFKKPKKTDFHLSADPAPLDYNLVIESPDSFLQKLKQTNPTAVIFTVTDPIPNPPIPTHTKSCSTEVVNVIIQIRILQPI